MKIIVTEKAIAGARIAGILAGRNVPETRADSAPQWEFTKDKEDYVVVPLRGHIIDVDFPKQYSYWIGTDLRKLNTAEIDYVPKEHRIISLLKKRAKSAEEVIIATDADREGEAIGVEALDSVKNANPKIKIKRAYFSAITPTDINEAFSNLVDVDYNLADSANSRREIDLIWGAVLTRFLSIVSGRLGKEFLSMGRVQGPVLGLIVEKEKERLAFEQKKYWVLRAIFEKNGKEFEAIHKTSRFWKKEEAEKILAKEHPTGKVVDARKKPSTLAKPVPFNTTGFLRAATLIGFSAGEAMNIAEKLYMLGFISYPRTDNATYPKTLNLKAILNDLLKINYFAPLAEKILALGALNPSRGKETKDHPPIHPVSAAEPSKLSEREWKIYELVVRNFLATLSEDAEIENHSVDIEMNNEIFVAKGLIVIKSGWKEFYPYVKLKVVHLPEMNIGDIVGLKKLEMLEKETMPPNRYSQGALIKLMEDLGLGTKSSRHEILKKLYSRQYIEGLKSIEPNKIAFAVVATLDKYGEKVVKPKMTSDLEKEMDLIAAGKKKKAEVVAESREFLAEILSELLANKDKIGAELRKALIADTMLAPCSKEGCNGTLRIIRSKSTGKRFVGCTNYPKCTNSFPLPQTGAVVNPGKTCEVCGNPMIKILGKRYRYEMCLNNKCPTKDEWKKNAQKKELAKIQKTEIEKAQAIEPAETQKIKPAENQKTEQPKTQKPEIENPQKTEPAKPQKAELAEAQKTEPIKISTKLESRIKKTQAKKKLKPAKKKY